MYWVLQGSCIRTQYLCRNAPYRYWIPILPCLAFQPQGTHHYLAKMISTSPKYARYVLPKSEATVRKTSEDKENISEEACQDLFLGPGGLNELEA